MHRSSKCPYARIQLFDDHFQLNVTNAILQVGKGAGGAGKSKGLGGSKVRPGFEGKTNAGFLNKNGGNKGGGGGKKK